MDRSGKKSHAICAAPGCSNTYKKGNLHLHKFPADPKMCERWVHAIKRRPQDVRWQTATLCSEHFQDEDYEVKGAFDENGCFAFKKTDKLKPHAVPSRFDFTEFRKGSYDFPSTSQTPNTSSDRSMRLKKRSETKTTSEVGLGYKLIYSE